MPPPLPGFPLGSRRYPAALGLGRQLLEIGFGAPEANLLRGGPPQRPRKLRSLGEGG